MVWGRGKRVRRTDDRYIVGDEMTIIHWLQMSEPWFSLGPRSKLQPTWLLDTLHLHLPSEGCCGTAGFRIPHGYTLVCGFLCHVRVRVSWQLPDWMYHLQTHTPKSLNSRENGSAGLVSESRNLIDIWKNKCGKQELNCSQRPSLIPARRIREKILPPGQLAGALVLARWDQ